MLFKKFVLSTVIFFIIVTFTNINTIFADNIIDYSILATDSLHIKKKARVKSGFVGVNDSEVTLDEGEDYEQAQLMIGEKVVTEKEVRLSAPRVTLKKWAKVKGDVYYRDKLNIQEGATILGAQVLKNALGD